VEDRKLSFLSSARGNGLAISVAVVTLTWAVKVAQNVFFLEEVLESFQRMSTVLLQALAIGVLTVVGVMAMLRLTDERLRDLGFAAIRLGHQVRNGCLFGLLIFLFDQLLISPALDRLAPRASGQAIDMKALFDSGIYAPVFLVTALFKGGFSEELWRVFTLTRFERVFGRRGLVVAVVVGSVVFGIGHLYQGVSGMVSIAVIGFCFALVYLRRRLAWEAVSAHASFNLIGIILGYIVYHGD
jgi:uncharacterized protein